MLETVLWYHPGKTKCYSVFGQETVKPCLKPGTVLRNGRMLGMVIDGIKHGEHMLYSGSVMVRCTCSIAPNTDLANPHVWYVPSCQILEGALLEAARKDPEALLRKFRQMEDLLHKEQATKPAKKMPGKRKL